MVLRIAFLPTNAGDARQSPVNACFNTIIGTCTMVHRCDLNFCHVELLFTDGASCTLFIGGAVEIETTKQFTRQDWRFRNINATPEQEYVIAAAAAGAQSAYSPAHSRTNRARVRAYCELRRGVGYDLVNIFAHLCCMPCIVVPWKLTCSRLVAYALQAGGLLPDGVWPMYATPNSLWDALEDRTVAAFSHPRRGAYYDFDSRD